MCVRVMLRVCLFAYAFVFMYEFTFLFACVKLRLFVCMFRSMLVLLIVYSHIINSRCWNQIIFKRLRAGSLFNKSLHPHKDILDNVLVK